MKKMITASISDSDVSEMYRKLKSAVWDDVFNEYCYEHDINPSFEPSGNADLSQITDTQLNYYSLEVKIDTAISDIAEKLVEYSSAFPKFSVTSLKSRK